MRRPPATRAPRLRSDAPIPPEMIVKMPSFLDALVIGFVAFMSTLDDVLNAKVPFLGMAAAYLVARIRFRASLYLHGMRWYNFDRLFFGGMAMCTDLVLWEFLQPLVGLVASIIWIAAVPWRDAPLSSVITRHQIVKDRIQLAIDAVEAVTTWPFRIKICERATQLYLRLNSDAVAFRNAQKPWSWSDLYMELDFDSFTTWEKARVKKICIVLTDSTSSGTNEKQASYHNFINAIVDKSGIVFREVDISEPHNFVNYFHYVGISGQRTSFPQMFIVASDETIVRYIATDEMEVMVDYADISVPELGRLGLLMDSMHAVFAEVEKRVDPHVQHSAASLSGGYTVSTIM